jgi:hypothetical protein
VQRGISREVYTTRFHKRKRPLDLPGDRFVALALSAFGDELLVPHVDLVEVGEATFRESADQVQRGDGLVISAYQPRWIRLPRDCVEADIVHGVTAE